MESRQQFLLHRAFIERLAGGREAARKRLAESAASNATNPLAPEDAAALGNLQHDLRQP